LGSSRSAGAAAPDSTSNLPYFYPVDPFLRLWVLVHRYKGGTTAVLHYDDYENLLCQVRGTKELVLFPPEDLENLYYVGRRKGKLKYEFPGRWTRYDFGA
ncbi:unnamed protein product, partial [Hapterophycus canaliculatus]